jgi:type IV secretory pathway TraG/TraD family ATPase VirD4
MQAIQTLRQFRKTARPLMRGNIPTIRKLSDVNSFFRLIQYTGLFAGLFALWGWAYNYFTKAGLSVTVVAETGGAIAFFCYGLWPFVLWMMKWTKQNSIPDANCLSHLGRWHVEVCIMVVALIFVGVGNILPTLLDHPPLTDNYGWLFFIWMATFLLMGLIVPRLVRAMRHAEQGIDPHKASQSATHFGLWIGRSTGQLTELSHGSGLAPQQHIALSLEDAAQNILVLGGTGSGKTTRAMHPYLVQLLDQGCGGLIFDVKGDFQRAVNVFASHTEREIITIGPGYHHINLLSGLTPEVASSFLKSVFLLNGKHQTEGFWVDTATELCRNTLGLLSFLPDHYNLQGLYSYLFVPELRQDIITQLDIKRDYLDDRDVRLFTAYRQYEEQVFNHFDEKVKAGVRATIAQVLSPFNQPELIDTFCLSMSGDAKMEDVLNGYVYLVSLPLSRWGLGAKVVYTMLKLRFYNVMQSRVNQPAWNQDRPVFFMCDEFQEIVSASKDGLSDLNFWDKSRSSKTIGIISSQAISSFYAAIDNRDVTHALLQNFRQKLCFRTEDTNTLNYFHSLADKVEVVRETYSYSKGKQSHSGRSGSSSSESENVTLTEKSVLSPQLFRKLQPDQMVALLSIAGNSMDDVVQVMPIYV